MNPLFEMAELSEFAGHDLVDQARDALDAQSISNYRFDARGRIEAAVKPTPKTGLKPGFARITRKGSNIRKECKPCGKSAWCIHQVMLVLHHLGVKPQFTRKTTPAQPRPELGLQIQLNINDNGGQIAIRAASTRRTVAQPQTFLLENPVALDLSENQAQLIHELCTEQESQLMVDRADMSRVLLALWRKPLVREDGSYWQWDTMVARPEVRVTLNHRFSWKRNQDPAWEAGLTWCPGKPGFFIQGPRIIRNAAGYTPDFEGLFAESEGTSDVDPNVIQRLLSERHHVIWETERPQVITVSGAYRLDLTPEIGGLRGVLNVIDQGQSWPLAHCGPGLNLLRMGQKWGLLHLSSFEHGQLQKQMAQMRVPWEDHAFQLRTQSARRFLSQPVIPKQWDVARESADRWFGFTRSEVSMQWHPDAPTEVTVDGETYVLSDLLGRVESKDLVHLPSGRLVHMDTLELQRMGAMDQGLKAIHKDIDKRSALKDRLLGKPEPLPPLPGLDYEFLRPYQCVGVQWLLQRHRLGEPALLADDMGLGKTIQTAVLLRMVSCDKPQLIVVPRSLLGNWERELHRFTPGRKLIIHHGSNRASDAELLRQQDVVITTYGTLRADLDLMQSISFATIVLDEAQAIKNPHSQTSQAVCGLRAPHRIALSGTPVENRMEELWSLFQFLAPGYLGEREHVRHIGEAGSLNYQIVRDLVAPFILRRHKSEVLNDLPEREDVTLHITLSNDERRFYQTLQSGAQAVIHPKSGKRNTMDVLTLLLRMRQACCHPKLVDEDYIGPQSSKIEVLIEHLTEVTANQGAALVFSQFTQLLKLVAFELEEVGMPFLYLDGQTRDRDQRVAEFQSGKAPIFLISLKAGGVGLNLTRASYVFILDPWWNPMAERQATDRAHRIGQTQKVTAYRMVAENTIEQRIVEMQRVKQALADGLFDDSGSGLAQLTDRDLEMLLA
ncbi:MAG: DEAD/DEAH box helicase [Acidobacteria bacterium]|nr:DEAD/DEAH box helicase [Acidobacteriota bacterium]